MKTLLNLFATKIRWWTVFSFLLVLSALALVIALIIDDVNYFYYSLSNFLILVLFLFGDILIDEWRERRKGRMIVNRK